jgi:hypothetical protein
LFGIGGAWFLNAVALGYDVVAKCQDLMAPVLGKQTTSKLIETVLVLEKLSNVRALRPMLQPS